MIKHLVLGAALVCASGSIANAGNGTNLTKFLPDTTQAVVVMDAQAARSSKLLQDSYQKMLAGKPDMQAKMKELGVDPGKDLDTILFAMGNATEMAKFSDSAVLVIVEGKIPVEKFKAQQNATKSTYNGVDIYTKDDGEGAFIDGRLFFAKKGSLKTTIDLVKGKGASLDKSKAGKAMRDVIASTNTKAHVWMSVLVPKKDRDTFAASKVEANSFALTLTFATDVTVGVRINTASEANATATLQMAQAALPQLTGAMSQFGFSSAAKSVTVTQDKASVNASVKVTEGEIKTLTTLLGAKLGGMMQPANSNAPAPTGGMTGAKH